MNDLIMPPDGRRKQCSDEKGFAEPEEIAAAMLFLPSDDARHVTGVDLPIEQRLCDHLTQSMDKHLGNLESS